MPFLGTFSSQGKRLPFGGGTPDVVLLAALVKDSIRAFFKQEIDFDKFKATTVAAAVADLQWFASALTARVRMEDGYANGSGSRADIAVHFKLAVELFRP